MPELAEAPAHVSPFKDPEVARQAAYASHKAQAELKEDGIRFRELAIEQAKQPPEPKPIEQTAALLEAQRQIELTNELVAHARAELKHMQEDEFGFCQECKRHGADAKDQAALLRELRGLMEHLCRLHSIAQAPTTKANPKPTQSRPRTIEPQAVVVVPVEPSKVTPNSP